MKMNLRLSAVRLGHSSNLSQRRLLSVLCACVGLVLALGLVSAFVLPLAASADKGTQNARPTPEATFENQTIFSGEAEPLSTVSYVVYTYRSQSSRRVLYQGQAEVGESGVYVLQVPLPLVGTQYVNLTVDGETTVYGYTRYSKSLLENLTEAELNVYEYLRGSK